MALFILGLSYYLGFILEPNKRPIGAKVRFSGSVFFFCVALYSTSSTLIQYFSDNINGVLPIIKTSIYKGRSTTSDNKNIVIYIYSDKISNIEDAWALYDNLGKNTGWEIIAKSENPNRFSSKNRTIILKKDYTVYKISMVLNWDKSLFISYNVMPTWIWDDIGKAELKFL